VPAFRATGWTLLLLWAIATVAAQFVGHTEGSAEDLRSGLRTGDVTRVVVDLERWPGEPELSYREGARNHVTVQWRDGWRLHRTTLTEYPTEERAERARARAERQRSANPHSAGPDSIVGGPVVDWLESYDAEVVVSDLPRASYSTGQLMLPTGLFMTLLGIAVATFLLVAVNARPWRASSWGWAWMVLVAAPLGVPAYLLFGGPTGLFRPAEPHRPKVTGGWSFLLVLFVLAPVTAGLMGGRDAP
jgi:hypothetical protein